MPEEYKLHLSRSVLFDASPLCAFLCTYGAVIDEKEFLKYLKSFYNKTDTNHYPLILVKEDGKTNNFSKYHLLLYLHYN